MGAAESTLNERRHAASRRPWAARRRRPKPAGSGERRSRAAAARRRRPFAGGGNRRLRRAGPWHQQLPPADRLSDRRRLSRGRLVLAHHPARRGDLGDRLYQRRRDRPRHRGAEHLPRQDPVQEGQTPAADRHRSLPRGVQCRRLHGPGGRRNRHPARGDRSRDRSRPGGDRLFAAARSAGQGRHPVRHRRRLDGTGPDRARSRRSRTRCRASRPGCRSRSASSRWPSISAARTSRRNPMPTMVQEVAQHVAPFAAEHGARSRRHAPARHLRHGDDAGRGPSQPGALRSPPDRRRLDERCGSHRHHRAPARA